MNSIKKLKVGIIVDDINQPYLVYDIYQKSLESNYYSIEYLVIQKTNNLKNKNLLNKLIDFSLMFTSACVNKQYFVLTFFNKKLLTH